MKESDPKFYFSPCDALHLTEINVSTEDDKSCSRRLEFSTGSRRILNIQVTCKQASEGQQRIPTTHGNWKGVSLSLPHSLVFQIKVSAERQTDQGFSPSSAIHFGQSMEHLFPHL